MPASRFITGKINSEQTPTSAVFETDAQGRVTSSDYWNTVFTAAERFATDRMYKVETMSYSEEGLVEISASYYPVNAADGSYSPQVLDFSGIDHQRVTRE